MVVLWNREVADTAFGLPDGMAYWVAKAAFHTILNDQYPGKVQEAFTQGLRVGFAAFVIDLVKEGRDKQDREVKMQILARSVRRGGQGRQAG